jgi:hypothetical protein
MLHQRAETELLQLDAGAQADVAWVFQQLDGSNITFIRSFLDKRTEPKVAQFEGSHPAGTLRVVFAWGKGCLWFIGAFVKANDPEGERYMKRILPRATEVKDLGATK